jgi:subtilisin family serine protease
MLLFSQRVYSGGPLLSTFRVTRFICVVLFVTTALVAQEISGPALQQMRDVYQIKKTLTTAQRKESLSLVTAAMKARHLSTGAVSDSILGSPRAITGNMALVDLKVKSVASVSNQIDQVGGQVISSSLADKQIRAKIPVLSIDAVANSADVSWIRAAARVRTNIGAVTSQGYVTHTANQAVGLGFNGTGVKVGVLSDSAYPARVAALVASGDLPPDVVVLPGEAGPPDGSGENEGTAMMEIVHDLAPGAKLFFASAYNGEDDFANNIRLLRFTYHCDIIVDDVTYLDEGAFQDGLVAQAVNAVTANGAMFFSAASNSGNLTSGTSGTWEGDFLSSGDAGSLLDVFEGGPVPIHNFGTGAARRNFDSLTGIETGGISLKWSDPLGESTNDYDLFVLDSTGTEIRAFSADSQTGMQDPFEFIDVGSGCDTSTPLGYCPAPGDRVVVVKYFGNARALRLDTNGGTLSIATDGSTYGHNGGASTITTAATAWNSAHAGTRPFTGEANPVETFSSDGPRKIFYTPAGVPITPGNVLFKTNGGKTLRKPDVTAADGVFAKTPGFLPFFGTSAAAPHAAAVAALVKSANPSLTNTQIRNILTSTTVDNMAPGFDRNSGYGIVMAISAVNAALTAH